jgi:hypothetical protein
MVGVSFTNSLIEAEPEWRLKREFVVPQMDYESCRYIDATLTTDFGYTCGHKLVTTLILRLISAK